MRVRGRALRIWELGGAVAQRGVLEGWVGEATKHITAKALEVAQGGVLEGWVGGCERNSVWLVSEISLERHGIRLASMVLGKTDPGSVGREFG